MQKELNMCHRDLKTVNLYSNDLVKCVVNTPGFGNHISRILTFVEDEKISKIARCCISQNAYYDHMIKMKKQHNSMIRKYINKIRVIVDVLNLHNNIHSSIDDVLKDLRAQGVLKKNHPILFMARSYNKRFMRQECIKKNENLRN